MMMKPDFFEKLLLLPLFQGIGRNEFLEIAERIRIGFQKKAKDVEFICQDSFCDSLYFVLDGELCVRRVSDNRNYVFFEWMNQPMVIQPECLFGLRTRYSRSFQAMGTVYLFELEKPAVRDILFNYPTFRINYLNLVSTQMQQTAGFLWKRIPQSVEERFIHFLRIRSLRPAGRKELRIEMIPLSEELGTTRLNVSKMLKGLRDSRLIEMKRGKIIIPSFENLLNRNMELPQV